MSGYNTTLDAAVMATFLKSILRYRDKPTACDAAQHEGAISNLNVKRRVGSHRFAIDESTPRALWLVDALRVVEVYLLTEGRAD